MQVKLSSFNKTHLLTYSSMGRSQFWGLGGLLLQPGLEVVSQIYWRFLISKLTMNKSLVIRSLTHLRSLKTVYLLKWSIRLVRCSRQTQFSCYISYPIPCNGLLGMEPTCSTFLVNKIRSFTSVPGTSNGLTSESHYSPYHGTSA